MSVSRKMTVTPRLAEIVRRAESSVHIDVKDARSYSKRLREIRQKMPEGYRCDDGYRYFEERKRAALRTARAAKWILTGRWARRHYGKDGTL